MSLCRSFLERVSVCILLIVLVGCTPETESLAEDEGETLSRTEFTGRIENFFEYTPLVSGVPSAFLIHLTDLSDGTPVARAQVDLSVRPTGRADEVTNATAQIGRVTGIYVADLSVPSSGLYDIEFRIRNDRLDERMLLRGFEVEGQR